MEAISRDGPSSAPCGMVCCLNPHCHQPQNPDDARFCQSCGSVLVPKLRDRYHPVRPLGQGGFGRSYLAIDRDRLDRPCVIKQFSPQGSNVTLGAATVTQDGIHEKCAQFFAEEAKRLSELGEHPQIPTLYAYFAEGGRLYLVQQLIEGETLAQQVDRLGPLSVVAVRSLLVDLLPVLAFVHDNQVIHRDIKPDNIVLPSLGAKPVLIDFGVAKQLTGELATKGGTRVGTEGYAPLEQLRSGHAFPASDLYSLAATALFALTGCAPESLFDPLANRWVWRDRLQDRGQAIEVIDPVLGQVLDRLLADRVSARYASAAEVLRALTGETVDRADGTEKVEDAEPTPGDNDPPIALDLARCKWRPTTTIAAHNDRICALAFSPDGQWLASGGGDRQLRLWDWRSGHLSRDLSGHEGRISALQFSPDGQAVISASSDRTIRVWPLTDDGPHHCLKHHQDWVGAIALSPDGQTLVSSGDDGRIVLWDWQRGELKASYKASPRPIGAITWSPDGTILISGGRDGTIGFWDARSGQLLTTLHHHLGRICALQVTPDGQWLVSAGEDKTIKLWRLDRGQPIDHKPHQVLRDSTEAIFGLAIAPNSGLLVSGGEDHTVQVWQLADCSLLQVLKGHSWWVNAVAIAPDGVTLASGSGDRTIQLWELA